MLSFEVKRQPKLELDMRLPLVKPASLTEQQKPLYEDMKQGIAVNFQGFANIGGDGALLGPWNPWLHEPKFGKPVWELVKTMVSKPSLPASVREVAILVTGAHFRSAYSFMPTSSSPRNADCPTTSLQQSSPDSDLQT